MVLLPGLWRNRISGDRSFHIMETAAKEDLDDLVYEQKPSSVARMVINNAML